MTRRFSAKSLLRAAAPLALVLIAAAAGAGMSHSDEAMPGAQANAETEVATFAGGCFWCMEPPYDALDGVISTTSGYTGGDVPDPTYREVSSGRTGHAEAVKVVYDPDKVSYETLLEVFWHNVDPLTEDAQFCDHGSQYRTAIFYHGEAQERLAKQSKKALEESGRFDRPIVTEIVEAGPFYPAEEYHQNYYKKKPVHYKVYRTGCGRDARLAELWGADAGGH